MQQQSNQQIHNRIESGQGGQGIEPSLLNEINQKLGKVPYMAIDRIMRVGGSDMPLLVDEEYYKDNPTNSLTPELGMYKVVGFLPKNPLAYFNHIFGTSHTSIDQIPNTGNPLVASNTGFSVYVSQFSRLTVYNGKFYAYFLGGNVNVATSGNGSIAGYRLNVVTSPLELETLGVNVDGRDATDFLRSNVYNPGGSESWDIYRNSVTASFNNGSATITATSGTFSPNDIGLGFTFAGSYTIIAVATNGTSATLNTNWTGIGSQSQTINLVSNQQYIGTGDLYLDQIMNPIDDGMLHIRSVRIGNESTGQDPEAEDSNRLVWGQHPQGEKIARDTLIHKDSIPGDIMLVSAQAYIGLSVTGAWSTLSDPANFDNEALEGKLILWTRPDTQSTPYNMRLADYKYNQPITMKINVLTGTLSTVRRDPAQRQLFSYGMRNFPSNVKYATGEDPNTSAHVRGDGTIRGKMIIGSTTYRIDSVDSQNIITLNSPLASAYSGDATFVFDDFINLEWDEPVTSQGSLLAAYECTTHPGFAITASAAEETFSFALSSGTVTKDLRDWIVEIPGFTAGNILRQQIWEITSPTNFTTWDLVPPSALGIGTFVNKAGTIKYQSPAKAFGLPECPNLFNPSMYLNHYYDSSNTAGRIDLFPITLNGSNIPANEFAWATNFNIDPRTGSVTSDELKIANWPGGQMTLEHVALPTDNLPAKGATWNYKFDGATGINEEQHHITLRPPADPTNVGEETVRWYIVSARSMFRNISYSGQTTASIGEIVSNLGPASKPMMLGIRRIKVSDYLVLTAWELFDYVTDIKHQPISGTLPSITFTALVKDGQLYPTDDVDGIDNIDDVTY